MNCSINRPLTLRIIITLLFVSITTAAYATTPLWRSQIVFPEQRQIVSPLSMTVDAERQRYYVIDTLEGQILSFDHLGKKLSAFNADGKLTTPVAMCFARPGKMWVVERSTNELLYIDLDTKQVRRFSPKNKHGKPLIVDHIATDSQWRLYVLDRLSGNVFRLDDNLNIATTYKSTKSGYIVDFKITDTGILALDRTQQSVLSFDFKGQLKQQVTLKEPLDFPVSLALNKLNQIFVLDRPQAKIAVFNTQGDHLYSFAQKGYRRGQLNYPNQILFDWQQQLCIVNQGNDCIEIFNH